MARLSNKAVQALVQGLKVTAQAPAEPLPEVNARTLLILQERVQMQQQCIEDLSRAVQQLQRRMYSLQEQRNQS